MSKHFPHIFEPFTVKRTIFRNRVVMPPMGSNYATYSGEVSEEMKDYYGLRARGGTALITVEKRLYRLSPCYERYKTVAYRRETVYARSFRIDRTYS